MHFVVNIPPHRYVAAFYVEADKMHKKIKNGNKQLVQFMEALGGDVNVDIAEYVGYEKVANDTADDLKGIRRTIQKMEGIAKQTSKA